MRTQVSVKDSIRLWVGVKKRTLINAEKQLYAYILGHHSNMRRLMMWLNIRQRWESGQ